MRYRLAGIVLVGMLSLSACQSGRSTRANPTAFCSANKRNAVKYAGLEDNPTKSGIEAFAAAQQKMVAIAPKEIESSVQTAANAWSKFAKTGDHSDLDSVQYAAAVDQVNTWEEVYCKQ